MITKPITLTVEQLDELHTLQFCLSAVTSLMAPCKDLSTVSRDELACLLDYLNARHIAVLKEVG